MSADHALVPGGCPRCHTVEHHWVDVTKEHGHAYQCDHCGLTWLPPVIDLRPAAKRAKNRWRR